MIRPYSASKNAQRTFLRDVDSWPERIVAVALEIVVLAECAYCISAARCGAIRHSAARLGTDLWLYGNPLVAVWSNTRVSNENYLIAFNYIYYLWSSRVVVIQHCVWTEGRLAVTISVSFSILVWGKHINFRFAIYLWFQGLNAASGR